MATSIYRMAVLTGLALVVGAAVSLAAIAFVEAVGWLNDTLLISPRARVQVEDHPHLVMAATVGVPVLGGLVVGLLLRFASPAGRPLGPPDATRAVQTRKPLPDARSGAVSTVAAAVSLGCGASVGQYGPMVYLGALIGELAGRLGLGMRNLPQVAIGCGVAAAISTAFNAPLAGLLFAHEVILRHYSIRAVAPTTVAAATGYVVANLGFERPPLFLVSFAGVEHGYEFLLFALIGVLAALLAVAFMRLTLWTAMIAPATRLPPWARPAGAGLAVGVVALWLPDVLGIGQETLRFATIEGAFRTWELAMIVVAKTALTALCVGFGFAGGVFSPALLIGVLSGALFWSLLDGIGGVANSGVAVYAICGMMAMTSPVIGAPLTTILIVFELTRNYDLTIAAMVSVVFANLVAHRLFGRSLYDVQLAGRGFDLSGGRDRALLQTTPVLDSAEQEFPRCRRDEAVADVLDRLAAVGRAEAFVVDTDGRYEGLLRAQDARGREHARVADVAIAGGIRFDRTTSIWAAMRALDDFVGDAVPVVDDDGRLLGVASEAAVIGAYMRTVGELRREENEVV